MRILIATHRKKLSFLTGLLLLAFSQLSAQNTTPVYTKQLATFRADYITNHEVITDKNQKKFFDFYAPDLRYKVEAKLERIEDTVGIILKTSNKSKVKYFVFAKAHFLIKSQPVTLTIYQQRELTATAEYKDYLFLPFIDQTCGVETYGAGRYIDLLTTDIKNNTIIIDFNKCYNPYCAYKPIYYCPIPPKENILKLPILAGEKKFKLAVNHE